MSLTLVLQIQEDMKTFTEQGIEMEEQRKTILKELEEQQTTAVKEKGEYSEKHAGVMKIIDQLKAGMVYPVEKWKIENFKFKFQNSN